MSGMLNLGIADIVAGQNQKEVTANTNFARLANAITKTFDANVTAGNVTLSNAQYQAAAVVRATNATTAGRAVTLPAVERITILLNNPANTHAVDFICGSNTLTLDVGETVLARTDGTTNGLVALIRGTAATPVSAFLALADTPAGYAGQGGRGVRVNAGATALEFTDFAAPGHTHDAGDITGGTLATARLGAGTADATTFLRGDQAWAAPTLAGMSDGPGSLAAAPGKLLQVNAGGTAVEFGLRHNMVATLDPGPGDDGGAGYAIGSIWFNRASNTLWLCQDASAGVAIWQPLYGGYGSEPMALSRNTELGTAAFIDAWTLIGILVESHDATYQMVPGDLGKLLRATSGTRTWTLPVAADVPLGWWCVAKNRSGNNLTINRSGADTIDAAATSLTIATGAALTIVKATATTWESY